MTTITVTRKEEVKIEYVQVHAGVRYWCDATVNGVEGDEDDSENDLGIPCREGDSWCPAICIETGVIENWTKGTTASVHYKVADECGWSLHDINGNEILSVDDGYVPDTLCPEGRGYGDYIIMNIDENGKIANWKFNPEDFTPKNED